MKASVETRAELHDRAWRSARRTLVEGVLNEVIHQPGAEAEVDSRHMVAFKRGEVEIQGINNLCGEGVAYESVRSDVLTSPRP